jgi:hypothetical protein
MSKLRQIVERHAPMERASVGRFGLSTCIEGAIGDGRW